MQEQHQIVERLIAKSKLYRSTGEYGKSNQCMMDALHITSSSRLDPEFECLLLIEAARSAYYISRFHESESHLDKLEEVLDRCEIPRAAHILADAAMVRSNSLRRAGRFEAALQVFDDMDIGLMKDCLPEITVEKLLIEGACRFYLGELDLSQELLETALGLASHHSFPEARSRVLIMLGYLAQGRGFLKKAADYFTRARQLSKSLTDRYGEAAAGLNMGIVLYLKGRLSEAERSILDAKTLFNNIEWHLGVCRCVLGLGNVCKLRRNFDKSISLYITALEIARNMEFRREESMALEYLGEVKRLCGNLDEAKEYLESSYDIAFGISERNNLIPGIRRRMGDLYLGTGNVRVTLAMYREGLSSAQKLGERLEEGLCLRGIGRSGFLCGDEDMGMYGFQEAIDVIRSTGSMLELAITHLVFAETLLDVRSHETLLEVEAKDFDPGRKLTAWKCLIEAVHLFGEIDIPFWNEKVDGLVEHMISKRRVDQTIQRQFREGKHVIQIRHSSEALIGNRMVAVSNKMLNVWKQAQFAATFTRPVLITGETGTGKELVAHLIHSLGDRAKCRFVAVNCAAVPDHLFESEFFGHRKGCFTGATTERRGIFEEANGGTLFLDEIGELTTLQQVKLLRVLQEGRVRRIGENVERPVDVRIISATNQNLEVKIDNGTLREDFYYRVNSECIHVPPLRERPEDIVPLVAFCLCGDGGVDKGCIKIESGVLKLLQKYHWPGNVRELFSVIERIKHISKGCDIMVDMLPERIVNGDSGKRQFEPAVPNNIKIGIQTESLKRALSVCKGNKSEAARWLGISRCTLYKQLRLAGLDYLINQRPAS